MKYEFNSSAFYKLIICLLCLVSLELIERNVANADPQTQSAKVLEKLCLSGDGLSCSTLAQTILDNKAIRKSVKGSAHHFFQQACDLDIIEACLEANPQKKISIGGDNFYVKTVYSNIEQARQNFQKACDHDFSDGCVELAFLHQHQIINTSNTKAAKVVSLYRRALKIEGQKVKYNKIYRKLGQLYNDGDLVQQDLDKAISYFKSGCNAGNDYSCQYVADWDTRTEMVWPVSDFVSLYDAEMHGNFIARQELHRLRLALATKSLVLPFREWEKNCLADNQRDCLNLLLTAHGRHQYYVFGQPIYKEFSELDRIQHYKAACSKELPLGCYLYSLINAQHIQIGKGEPRPYLEKACSFENGHGCYLLADHLKGSGHKNIRRISELLERACHLKHRKACSMLER